MFPLEDQIRVYHSLCAQYPSTASVDVFIMHEPLMDSHESPCTPSYSYVQLSTETIWTNGSSPWEM